MNYIIELYNRIIININNNLFKREYNKVHAVLSIYVYELPKLNHIVSSCEEGLNTPMFQQNGGHKTTL
jgi:hypothetical protein